ncbi:MAG TPA: hypothetical protein PLK12_02125 [Prolixibacteraceae bacterium]|nr:hypothetical protein [Prolixibacteraceae bacterium]
MKTIKILFAAAFMMVGVGAMAQWNTNGTNVYYNGGNVGIGTDSPNRELTVYGANKSITKASGGRVGDGLYASLHLEHTTTGDLFNASLRATSGQHEMIQSVYSSSLAAWLEYCYVNLATANYEMRSGIADASFLNSGDIIFNNGGGVVIGNTSVPSGSKLAVDGKISSTEVEVTLDAWSDYVFDEDYTLRPLSEVEKFVKENKHLPGIPSEKEIIENGLSLGEMNKLLMEKIEELTLYIIDLKKEVELLKE